MKAWILRCARPPKESRRAARNWAVIAPGGVPNKTQVVAADSNARAGWGPLCGPFTSTVINRPSGDVPEPTGRANKPSGEVRECRGEPKKGLTDAGLSGHNTLVRRGMFPLQATRLFATGADANKVAHYMLRWGSTRGEPGPWSETASATIGA